MRHYGHVNKRAPWADLQGVQPMPEDGTPVQLGDACEIAGVSIDCACWLLSSLDGTKCWLLGEWDGVVTDRATPLGRSTKADTQERIDADALKDAVEYWRCDGILCSSCPAKIDRKMPDERFGVNTCITAQKLDLLRRQRELDGRA